MSLLSGILFIMLGLGADGVPPVVQLRTPPPSMMGLPNLPASLEGYSYIIMKLGPLQLTRKGLSVASTSACLTFTVSFLMFALAFHFFLQFDKDVLDAYRIIFLFQIKIWVKLSTPFSYLITLLSSYHYRLQHSCFSYYITY